MDNNYQETQQELQNDSETTFQIKSVQFMCDTCNRHFFIVTPENGQGTCPRCDKISTIIVNDADDGKDTRATETVNNNNNSNSNTSDNNTQTQSQEDQAQPEPQQPQVRIRIMRRIIFRPIGVIVIETVVPVNLDGTEQEQNNQASQEGNAQPSENRSENQSENQPQDQSQRNRLPFIDLLELLLGGLNGFVGQGEGVGFDRIIEEFLRNDPNTHGPAPASEDNINSLKEFSFEPENAKHSQCSICQEDYNQGDKNVALPCEHNYHKDCVVEWLKLHDSCPNCRKPITPKQEAPKVSTAAEQDNSNHQTDS